MIQRGKQSLARQSVLPVTAPQRPEPPSDLSPEEVKQWHLFAARKPPDWFTPANTNLLILLCSQIVAAAKVRQAMHKSKEPDSDLLHQLSHSTKHILSLMARLNITKQPSGHSKLMARRNADKDQQRPAPVRRPWD